MKSMELNGLLIDTLSTYYRLEEMERRWITANGEVKGAYSIIVQDYFFKLNSDVDKLKSELTKQLQAVESRVHATLATPALPEAPSE